MPFLTFTKIRGIMLQNNYQMIKEAITSLPITNEIKNRWSTRAYALKPVEESKLYCILEAGRWAASAFNEQPWRFIVGVQSSENYTKIVQCLDPWNQQWAKNAPILILNMAKNTFSHNGSSNPTALYDLGQAVASMAIEAVHQGLNAHQMSGFDAGEARIQFNIDNDFSIVSVTAVGYYGEMTELPDDIMAAENRDRQRKSLNDLLLIDRF